MQALITIEPDRVTGVRIAESAIMGIARFGPASICSARAIRRARRLRRELPFFGAIARSQQGESRLQGELRALLRHRTVRVDYVEPPADGRPLPGEVAHAARAMVRTIVMVLGAQPELNRIRIAWDCDGDRVIVDVRDQGPGEIDCTALSRQLSGRLSTLRGKVDMESIPVWGSRVTLTIPLGPPAARPDEHLLSALNPRELEVLSRFAVGKRNRTIGAELGISESTVKFHVASVLRKLDAANRGEAGAIAIRAGIVPVQDY